LGVVSPGHKERLSVGGKEERDIKETRVGSLSSRHGDNIPGVEGKFSPWEIKFEVPLRCASMDDEETNLFVIFVDFLFPE
jgi:hypothetical protein